MTSPAAVAVSVSDTQTVALSRRARKPLTGSTALRGSSLLSEVGIVAGLITSRSGSRRGSRRGHLGRLGMIVNV